MKKLFIAIATVSIMITSCKEKESSNKEISTTVEEQITAEESSEKQAICLLEKLYVREEPKAKGKWITSMSLGEKVSLTGEEAFDSITKKRLCKGSFNRW